MIADNVRENPTVGEQITFAFEASERLRVAVLGTSGHALRNYLPVLPFLPVEYVGQWDPDRDKAKAFARLFGAGDAAIVENAMRLTYYRKASLGQYGRTVDALTSLANAPVRWEPEFSLGQLYNDHNFIQGYGQALLHFCWAALSGQPTTVGTLEDALEVLKVHDALCQGPNGVVTLDAG